MVKKYKKYKDITLYSLNSWHIVLESLLIIVVSCAIYLMISLISFNPSDFIWLITFSYSHIRNLGGYIGAWIADTMLLIFGVVAYIIPAFIMSLCWFIFQYLYQRIYIDYFVIALRLIGISTLIVTTCALITLNISEICYFNSGGIIGNLVSLFTVKRFNLVGGTFILLCIWAVGFILYTGCSWIMIIEKIGDFINMFFTLIKNIICYKQLSHKNRLSEKNIKKDQHPHLVSNKKEKLHYKSNKIAKSVNNSSSNKLNKISKNTSVTIEKKLNSSKTKTEEAITPMISSKDESISKDMENIIDSMEQDELIPISIKIKHSPTFDISPRIKFNIPQIKPNGELTFYNMNPISYYRVKKKQVIQRIKKLNVNPNLLHLILH